MCMYINFSTEQWGISLLAFCYEFLLTDCLHNVLGLGLVRVDVTVY